MMSCAVSPVPCLRKRNILVSTGYAVNHNITPPPCVVVGLPTIMARPFKGFWHYLRILRVYFIPAFLKFFVTAPAIMMVG